MPHRIEDCCDLHLNEDIIPCLDCRYQDRGIELPSIGLYNIPQPCYSCLTESRLCYWKSTGGI